MPAVQPAGVRVRADQPLPLLRGERQIHRPPAMVVGDHVARHLAMCNRVLERVQDGAVGAGRLQLDHARELVHRRAVLPNLRVNQRHVVVRVMCRDPLDVRQLRREPASPLHRLPYKRERDEGIIAVAAGGVEPLEQLPVVIDQPLRQFSPLLA